MSHIGNDYLLKRMYIEVLSKYSWRDDLEFFDYQSIMEILSEPELNLLCHAHLSNAPGKEGFQIKHDQFAGKLIGTLKTKPQ